MFLFLQNWPTKFMFTTHKQGCSLKSLKPKMDRGGQQQPYYLSPEVRSEFQYGTVLRKINGQTDTRCAINIVCEAKVLYVWLNYTSGPLVRAINNLINSICENI